MVAQGGNGFCAASHNGAPSRVATGSESTSIKQDERHVCRHGILLPLRVAFAPKQIPPQSPRMKRLRRERLIGKLEHFTDGQVEIEMGWKLRFHG